MTNKKVALISTVVSLMVSFGWQFESPSVHASRNSTAPGVQGSAPPSDPLIPTWEYRILIYPSRAASRRLQGYSGPNLEDEINKLAEQGFVVDRFQTLSSPNGSGQNGYFSISGSSDIVALLKRARK